MRWIIWVLAVVLGTANAAFALELAEALPPGAQIAFSGSSFAELARVAKPQMQDDDSFIWTAKDAQGERTFTVAQAVQVANKGTGRIG